MVPASTAVILPNSIACAPQSSNHRDLIPEESAHVKRSLVMSAHASKPTFAERFVDETGAQARTFPDFMLARCLYAPLRWIYPLLRRHLNDYLEPELTCLAATANLRSLRELDVELAEFSHHRDNRRVLRRWFRQRLSTRRLFRVCRSLARSSG